MRPFLSVTAIFLSNIEKGNPHMNLAKELLSQIADPALTRNQRAQIRCQLAKQQEEVGNYEGARESLRELWGRIGDYPALDELDDATAADVLLRAGVLTGWIGSVKQIENSQELAKNLINESLRKFEELQHTKKIAEAQTELGYCYWRQGAFDEARIRLKDALGRLDDKDGDLKAITLLRLASVEKVTNRLSDALRLLTEAAPLFDASGNHTIKGRFHNEFGAVLMLLSKAEHRGDYADRAFLEYTAASYHFEQAGNTRYHACVENNLGYLFLTIGKLQEAHQHLDRAQALFTSIKDDVHTAQVDDTRAKVLLAEGRTSDAEKLIRTAVQILDKGGEQSLLAEALTTQGIALARLERHQQAHLTLQRAVEVAYRAGDSESAGQSALTIIEELGESLSHDDLIATYERAVALLAKTQDIATLMRMNVCALRVLFLVDLLSTPPDWTGFSFKKAVRRFEARLLEKALRDAGGTVSRAARLLGFAHHHSLNSMLKKRHRELLSKRTPIVPRKRSIITTRDTPPNTPVREAQATEILYVEDNEIIANAVRELLESEGWKVETCADGMAAHEKVTSYARYDILIFDNDLPGVNGLDLVRHARQLPHRRRTPIIMLTASDFEREARGAGADAFLSKTKDTAIIVNTIERLLMNETK
jgi:two-component system chemotaxis response regulator CheY